MKHIQSIKSVVLFLVILVSMTSCTTEDLGRSGNKAAVSVSLRSTSTDVSEVFLDIEDVQLKVGQSPSESWISLNAINTGTHNISDLTEASALLLVDHIEIDPTYINEVKLVLGDNNFMNINNVLVNLERDESTIASNLVQRAFEGSYIYQLIIDIDIDQSIEFNEATNAMVLNPKLQTEIRKF
ncbi:DUF4382 domain-containing protein [Winogradskyella eckloniae]|uniref:DUF4382 domain-containing protein n=1 Tax=Winogradskyella eckloniae TaxID=1089306 RepID=UPI0015670C30|nr:DUF4382 domain-containing protein [Winogradskyella eckloniae]NRD18796.1 DUF4382 domain-containing protein [Winogradskyella eckloniae]